MSMTSAIVLKARGRRADSVISTISYTLGANVEPLTPRVPLTLRVPAIPQQHIGGSGDDVLSGLAGNDFLHGDLGDDLLLGGDGADNLRLTGADTLVAEPEVIDS
jgi:hypothetical protein